MSFDLNGNLVTVTGAGGGINLAYAKKLLEGGANVLIADLKLLSEAEGLIKQYDTKPKALFQATDVTSWTQLETIFKVAIDHFVQVDIVCPGAGVFEPLWSSFWYPPGSPESQDGITQSPCKLLDINLTHPIRTAQMAIARFLSSDPPVSLTNPKRLVFIASIVGEFAFLATPLYHASKYAIVGFINSIFALGNHTGIKAVGVAPGIVKIRLWTEHEDKMTIVFEECAYVE